jgi:hypothetical protein
MNVHAPLVTPSPFVATRLRLQRLRHLSLADAATAATFSVIVSLALRPVADPDSLWHLATGRWIWKHHQVPKADPFSWTAPGRSWVAHEWLTEAIWYPVHKVFGWSGLAVLTGAVIVAALVTVWRTARSVGGTAMITNDLVLLAALASLHTWGVRPQMLTFALMALVASWTIRAWSSPADTMARRRLWLLPAIMVPWANAHGGYIFGIALLGMFAAGITFDHLAASWSPRYREYRHDAVGSTDARLVRTSWYVLVATTAATLLNPHGLRGLIYPFTYLGDNASTRYVAEWAAPDFAKAQFWPFAAFLVLAVFALVRLRRRLPMFAVVQMVAFGFFGVQSVRNITQFVATALPWVALSLKRNPNAKRSARRASRQAPANAHIVHLVIASAAVLVLGGRGLAQARPATIAAEHAREFPTEAVEWLRDHPKPKLLNQYDWGGYLTWHLPLVPVAVDGRPDMYGDAFMDRHVSMWRAEDGWQQRLEADGYQRVFGAPTQPIVKALRSTAGWKVVYEDPQAVVIDRADSE